jgi:NADPH-dependent 2,4-dienoyl-CoA reductase/sulfur reductase-like enzyme
VLFDENPGVGGQIYRGITATPVRRSRDPGRGLLGGRRAGHEARRAARTIVTGATVWSLDPNRSVGVSIAGQARLIAGARVIIATGSLERPFPIPGWTLPGVMTRGRAQTALKAQGLVPTGRTVMAGAAAALAARGAAAARRRQDRGDPRHDAARQLAARADASAGLRLSPYWSKGWRCCAR